MSLRVLSGLAHPRVVLVGMFFTWSSARFSAAMDWPQWLGPKRNGVWEESGILEKFPAAGLTYRWRIPIGGGFAGPAVAGGRVFVQDRLPAPEGPKPASPFDRGIIPGKERILCLAEDTGRIRWQFEYDCPYTVSYASGPRATPAVDGDRVYCLGAEGDLICLNSEDGNIRWRRDFKQDFGVKTPMWGFAGHPLVDGPRLICLAAGEGSVAVAFDKLTGKELWRALSAKEPGYAPPMIYEFGGVRQLIIWHPEAVSGLDPETGKVRWTHAMNPSVRAGMSIPTPLKVGERLFLTSFYNGSVMLEVGADRASVVWQSRKVSEKDTDGLHSVMATPLIEGGHIYSPCSYGEFRCLRAETGDRIWETFAPTSGKSARWGHAFVVKNGDRAVLFSETGDLILARLSPEKYEELSRTRLLEATNPDPGRPVVWSHPAFANRCVFARNDREVVCADLSR